MFFLVHEFCDISSFLGGGQGGQGGGGDRGHSDQPPARREGEGLGAVPSWLSLLTFRKPLAPGRLGPLGGTGLPTGRAVPTSSWLGPELHKGEDCSHRGAWAGKHKWPLCLLLRVWTEAILTAGQRCRAGWALPRPSLGLSQWERQTSEGTDSHLFLM